MTKMVGQPDVISAASVDADEVAKFSALAAEWWDPNGKFKPLHKFNPTRLISIREQAVAHFSLDDEAPQPLKGLRVLDIGCGGGLLSEPLSRLGASVTGVDASAANVKTALVHAGQQGLDIDYRHGAAEQLLESGEAPFDLVLAMEIVEHVADVDSFLSACAGLTRSGGMVIAATLNRTPKAFALAIVGAEYVLRWLPRGTHQFEKFVKPSEIRAVFDAQGVESGEPIGVNYNPLLDEWRLSSDATVNYMIVGRKAGN